MGRPNRELTLRFRYPVPRPLPTLNAVWHPQPCPLWESGKWRCWIRCSLTKSDMSLSSSSHFCSYCFYLILMIFWLGNIQTCFKIQKASKIIEWPSNYMPPSLRVQGHPGPLSINHCSHCLRWPPNIYFWGFSLIEPWSHCSCTELWYLDRRGRGWCSWVARASLN